MNTPKYKVTYNDSIWRNIVLKGVNTPKYKVTYNNKTLDKLRTEEPRHLGWIEIMNGNKLKELISRIPDDAEVVHLWNGGFAWREGGGTLHAYSFKPDYIEDK